MITIIVIVKILICTVLGYAIGNISSALLLSKLFFGQDIRNYGSKSAGATNMFRTYGAKFGALTLVLDIIKGIIACAIAKWIGGEVYADICLAFAGVAVVVGHDWPALYKFKGGKGAATSIGVMMLVNPWVAIGCLLFALLLSAITRYMSVGSLVGILIGCIYAFIFGSVPVKLLFVVILILDFWQHRANIVRLFQGKENPMFSRSLLDRFRKK